MYVYVIDLLREIYLASPPTPLHKWRGEEIKKILYKQALSSLLEKVGFFKTSLNYWRICRKPKRMIDHSFELSRNPPTPFFNGEKDISQDKT